jgi:hypothetical protein
LAVEVSSVVPEVTVEKIFEFSHNVLVSFSVFIFNSLCKSLAVEVSSVVPEVTVEKIFEFSHNVLVSFVMRNQAKHINNSMVNKDLVT